MDFLHRLFGSGAHTAPHPRVEELRTKYSPLLNMIEERGGRLDELRMEGERLVLRATTRSASERDALRGEIDILDPNHSDLSADIRVGAENR
jgi:hypothetical protein